MKNIYNKTMFAVEESNYICLAHEREFINANKSIFRLLLVRAESPADALGGFSIGSRILMMIGSSDDLTDTFERILELLDNDENRTEYADYFTGHPAGIRSIIIQEFERTQSNSKSEQKRKQKKKQKPNGKQKKEQKQKPKPELKITTMYEYQKKVRTIKRIDISTFENEYTVDSEITGYITFQNSGVQFDSLDEFVQKLAKEAKRYDLNLDNFDFHNIAVDYCRSQIPDFRKPRPIQKPGLKKFNSESESDVENEPELNKKQKDKEHSESNLKYMFNPYSKQLSYPSRLKQADKIKLEFKHKIWRIIDYYKAVPNLQNLSVVKSHKPLMGYLHVGKSKAERCEFRGESELVGLLRKLTTDPEMFDFEKIAKNVQKFAEI